MSLTSKCYICNTPINQYYKLCSNCNFDSDIMISTTEAKRIYKLTNDEIDEGDLFYITFEVHGNTGTKYIRQEIHDLAKELTEALPDKDKRKMAFMKQEGFMMERKETEKQRKERYKSLSETVKNLMEKFDDDKYITAEVRVSISGLINKYTDDSNISILVAAAKVLDYVKDKIETTKRLENRKKNIDDLIVSQLDEKDWETARRHHNYIIYINDDTGSNKLEEYFSKIKKTIDADNLKNKQRNDRQTAMDDWINSTFDKKTYIKVAKLHTSYRSYIHNNDKTFEKCKTTIQTHIESLQQKQSRKTKLNYWITKNVPKDHKQDAKETKPYTSFIDHGDINKIDNTKKEIKCIIDKLVEKDNRELEIHKEIHKRGLDIHKIPTLITICEKYINNNISSQLAIDQIDRIYKNSDNLDNLKKLICTEFSKYKNIIYKHPNYIKFIMGEEMDISYEELINNFREIVKNEMAKLQDRPYYVSTIMPNKQFSKFRKSAEYAKFINNIIDEEELIKIIKNRYKDSKFIKDI